MAKQGSMFRLTIIVAVVLLLLGYAIFNTRLLISGPKIILEDLYNGMTVENDLIEIRGVAEGISYLSLNGRQIYVDQNHNFKEKVLLTDKINYIEIFAKDKFEKTQTKKITILNKNYNKEEKEIALSNAIDGLINVSFEEAESSDEKLELDEVFE